MKKIISIPVYFFVFLCSMLIVSCSDDNPVTSQDGPYQFDKARYEWRTDTLYSSYVSNLFGFDTSHVFFLGTHSISIYNGENYSSYAFDDMRFNVIGGLDNYNVYIGGKYPNGDYRVMKWDGASFTDIPMPSDTATEYGITGILVQSPNEIWLGTQGKIFFADGVSFKEYKIDSASVISRITLNNGVLLASGRRIFYNNVHGESETYVYKFENASWVKIYSEIIPNIDQQVFPSQLGNELFGVMEEGVFGFNNSSFVKMISSPSPYKLGGILSGSNENEILAYGYSENYDESNAFTINWNGSKWSKEFKEPGGMYEMKKVGDNYYCIVPSYSPYDRALLRIGRKK